MFLSSSFLTTRPSKLCNPEKSRRSGPPSKNIFFKKGFHFFVYRQVKPLKNFQKRFFKGGPLFRGSEKWTPYKKLFFEGVHFFVVRKSGSPPKKRFFFSGVHFIAVHCPLVSLSKSDNFEMIPSRTPFTNPPGVPPPDPHGPPTKKKLFFW